MKSLFISVAVVFVLIIVAFVQRIYRIPRLPDQVASHINLSGEVDRWQEKEAAVAASLESLLVVSAIFGCMTIFSLLAVWYLPEKFINLPNKSYWLANKTRRRAALEIILECMLWFFAIGIAFFILCTEELVHASYTGKSSGYFLLAIIGLLIGLIFVITRMMLQLKRPNSLVSEVV